MILPPCGEGGPAQRGRMGVSALCLPFTTPIRQHPTRAMPAHPLSVGSADTFPRKGERDR